MVSCPIPYKVAHRRGVKSQMAGYFTLPIPMFFDSLGHLPVSFFSVLEYTLLEYFFKCRSVCVPLAPRYLGHMFVFLQMIGEAVYEFVFAQDDLPLNIEHDGFFTDSPFNKLAVFLFCLVSLPAEEDIPCLQYRLKRRKCDADVTFSFPQPKHDRVSSDGQRNLRTTDAVSSRIPPVPAALQSIYCPFQRR